MEARREQPVERRVLRGRGGKMEFEVERTRVPHTGTCRPAVSPPECPSQPGGASPGVSVTAVTLLKRASGVLGLSTRCPFPPTPLPGGRSTCRPRVPRPRPGPGESHRRRLGVTWLSLWIRRRALPERVPGRGPHGAGPRPLGPSPEPRERALLRGAVAAGGRPRPWQGEGRASRVPPAWAPRRPAVASEPLAWPSSLSCPPPAASSSLRPPHWPPAQAPPPVPPRRDCLCPADRQTLAAAHRRALGPGGSENKCQLRHETGSSPEKDA